jgi:OOP family OmpA-OmpF porin
MCQPRVWWWGLLPLALLWIVANLLRSGPVEADLAARATAAFGQDGIAIAGQPWASVSFAGRDGSITGQSAGPDSSALAAASALRVWGVRQVSDASVPVPSISPYRLTLRREGRELGWQGHVPPDNTRLALAAETKRLFPELAVRDGLAFGRGAPAGLDGAAALMMDQASRLASGEVALSDTSISITGTAASSADYDAALNAMAALPAGFRAGTVDLKPPALAPYSFGIDKNAAGLSLSGAVPDRATRERIATGLAGQNLRDGTAFASGAPVGFPALAATLVDWAKRLPVLQARLTDGRLDLSGEAADWASFDAVQAGLQALPAGITPGNVNLTPPIQRPFTWSATRTAGEIVLAGHVPDETTRNRLLAEARALWPAASVIDAMRVARGAPADFDQATAAIFALGQLARLDSGAAELADRTLAMRGRASDGTVRSAVLDTVASGRPAGLAAGSIEITEPVVSPYILSVTRRDGVVNLQGHVPDEAARRTLTGIVRERFLGERIEDGLRIGAGAPAEFLRMARDLLGKLARLPSGSVEISDKSLRLSGEALHERALAEIRGTLAEGLPPGWAAEATLGLRPPGPLLEPQQCQSQLIGLLGRGRLLFETGRADIAAASSGLLDNLVYVLNSCPQARVTIEGHTDSDGAPEFNLDLSQRRARAVADYLTQAGISPQRLATEGYGATRPVVANDSEAGKARNRRIEFLVSQ